MKKIITVIIGLSFTLLTFQSCNKEADQKLACFRQKTKNFTAPILDCHITKKTQEDIKLEESLNEKISEYLKNKNLQASLYYYNFKREIEYSFNKELVLPAASLSKVPLFMVYLNHAEDYPEVLKKELLYKEEHQKDYSVKYPPPEKLTPGENYPIEDLMYKMLVHSDNPSRVMLIKNIIDNIKKYNPKNSIHYNAYSDLFADLHIQSPDDNPTALMTSKEIARFFKSLYNASFLNKKNSSYTLRLMTESSFDKGIIAGVPKPTIVAHKFGESFDEQLKLRFLHDCGIVYKKDAHYLLCMMSRGGEHEPLEDHLRKLSQIVYESSI